MTGTLPGRERGSIMVLAALGATAAMGFAAISLDVGRLYAARQRVIDVCDAAAIAGAQELPDDSGAAIASARDFLARNGLDPSTSSIAVSADGTRLTVQASDPVSSTFGKVLGIGTSMITGSSTIEVGVTGSVTGAVPFGVELTSFETGEEYVIKLGSSSPGPHQGNFHAIALGGLGGSNYREMVKKGYSGVIEVGDEIETEPGNMVGPTKDGLRARFDLDPYATFDSVSINSPRVLKVPLVTSFTSCNGRSMVRVLGFAAFFLEDRNICGEIHGRFMKVLGEGEMCAGAPDYGLRSFRLLPADS